MRTAIYVDGFNLYYWMKPSPYRWIDVKALVSNAIARPDKKHEIAWLNLYDVAVVISNDSDLERALLPREIPGKSVRIPSEESSAGVR